MPIISLAPSPGDLLARRVARRGVSQMNKKTPEERFWGKVEKKEGCWEWVGSSSRGYGEMQWEHKLKKAHRISYELLKGKIPEGLEIDHLCRNKLCVNPDHLEPVTKKENIRRMRVITRVQYVIKNRARTHCVNGHPLTENNIYIDSTDMRRCKQCNRDKVSRFYYRNLKKLHG